MLKEEVTIKETIDFINQIIQIDKEAVSKLFSSRVPCNEELANHPSVQVADDENRPTVSMIGVINGLFGVLPNGWGVLTFIFEDGILKAVRRTGDGDKCD